MLPTVYYTQVESPWGPLFLAGTDRGICCCEFMGAIDLTQLLFRLRQRQGRIALREDSRKLAAAVEALQRYFSEEPEDLRYPLALKGSGFQLQVWSALQRIPLGQVATYGEIAAQVGKPRAARAVGQACGSNPVVLFVPCHRVVAARGKLGGFSSGLAVKESLLHHEGFLGPQPPAVSHQQLV